MPVPTEFQHLVDEVEDKILKNIERIPENSTWGFYSYGDAPGGIGGGSGCFLWFESKEDTLDYIGRLLAVSPSGPSSSDYPAILQSTAAIVREWEAEKINTTSALDRLNTVLRHHSQIEWCGQFEELISGESEFAKGVRSTVRDDESSDSIKPEELQDFLEELSLYGI